MEAADERRSSVLSRLSEARTACFEGRVDEARTAYREAEAGYRGLDDSAGIADALSELGALEGIVARPGAGRHMLEEALRLSIAAGDAKRRAIHLARLGDLEAGRGHCDAAMKRYEQSRTLFRDLSDEVGEALTWRGTGAVALAMSNFAEAREGFERAHLLHVDPACTAESAILSRCTGDLERRTDRNQEAAAMYREAEARYDLLPTVERGYLHFGVGEIARMTATSEATPDHRKALELFASCGHRAGVGIVYCALGEAARVAGEGSHALASFNDALEHLKAADHRLGMGHAHRGIGLVERNRNRYAAARRAYREAKYCYQSARYAVGEAHVRRGLGEIDYLQGHRADAERNLVLALSLYEAAESRLGEANTQVTLGDLARSNDDATAAEAAYLRARTLYEEIGDQTGVASATKNLAFLDLVAGRNTAAHKRYSDTLDAFSRLKVRSGIAESERGLAEAELGLGRLDAALAHCDSALEIFRDIGQELAVAQTLQSRGEVLVAMSNVPEAVIAFSQAATTFELLESREEQEECLRRAKEISESSMTVRANGSPGDTAASSGPQEIIITLASAADPLALSTFSGRYGAKLKSVNGATVSFSEIHLGRLLEDCERGQSDMSGGAPNVLEITLSDGECLFEKLPDVMSSTSASIDVNDRKLARLLTRADVLIVTSAEIERRAVLSRLMPLKGETLVQVGSQGNVTYSIGQFGRYATAHVHTTQGPDGRLGATLTIAHALRDVSFKACFVVGIAFGFDRKTQRMGDVLVAEMVQPYEHAKVEGDAETYAARGAPIPCGTLLSERFRNRMGDWSRRRYVTQVALHQGTVLSGAKLVNSRTFRDRLYEQFKQHKPVGGEMEGHAAYAAAQMVAVEVVLVKAICDWADGDKNDRAQKFAVDMAVDACYHLLSKPNILSDLGARDFPAPSAGASPNQSAHRKRKSRAQRR